MVRSLPEQHCAIIANKLADGQIALCVGESISRQAIAKDGSARRLPLWKELAEQVAKACHEDLNAYDGNILDLFDAIELGQSRFTLEEAVRASLDDSAYDPSPAHRALAELPWAAVYTTNYDRLLARVLTEQPVFEEEQYDLLQPSDNKRSPLFHVHGTLAKPHTLTREDYRLWPEKHPRAYRQLEKIILNKTVLFVGYSLSDPHLSDGILPMVRKITAGRERRLYAWMWKTPQNQVELLARRDNIEAISIQRGEEWAAAFRQVADALPEFWRAPEKLAELVNRAREAERRAVERQRELIKFFSSQFAPIAMLEASGTPQEQAFDMWRKVENEVLQRIQNTAYSFWESAGRQQGKALDDWIQAQLLSSQIAAIAMLEASGTPQEQASDMWRKAENEVLQRIQNTAYSFWESAGKQPDKARDAWIRAIEFWLSAEKKVLDSLRAADNSTIDPTDSPPNQKPQKSGKG